MCVCFGLFVKSFSFYLHRQILKKLKITVHTAILEADDILPTIARDLGATLLSGDSDFLLADIPGGVISPMSLLAHNMLLHHDHRQDRPYLPCKIYRISRLLAKYRGLTLELAPLAGPLVGNDYIDGSKTDGLVGRLPKPVDTSLSSSSSSYNQPKIETVFSWLATQSSVASAVANLKRLARSPSGHHPAIAFIESHFIEPSSPLETVSTKGQSVEEYFSANAHRLFSNLEPDIPAWAFKSTTSGPLKRRLLTIFTSQLDFASPLVEDLSREESSHEAAFELCQYIYGLLRRGDDDAHPKVITRYVRVGQQRAEQKVAPKTVVSGCFKLGFDFAVSNFCFPKHRSTEGACPSWRTSPPWTGTTASTSSTTFSASAPSPSPLSCSRPSTAPN